MNDPMGFLIISEGGDGLGLAIRLQSEGFPVNLSIKDPSLGTRGENLVQKGEGEGFSPIFLADCTGSGHLLDSYKASGGYTFGGSKIADQLESDRAFSSEVFKSCGVQEPDSKEFVDWNEAENFVQSLNSSTRLVFKPEGQLSGNLPSYVSYDNDDMQRMLKQFRKQIGESDARFVLQEFIKGTCISSEAWYSKDHFIRPFNHTLERKQLMVGDLGPSGGCTGNVVWVCVDSSNCPLCENLLKLEPFLEEHEYNGCIDINSVVDSEGVPYALEFTPRFGYDAFPTLLLGLFEGSFGSFVESCAKGSTGADMPLRRGFAAGVRISTPPWPSEDFNAKEGLPLLGLSGDVFSKLYPYEISRTGGELKTSGGCGIIGVAVGFADEIEGAFAEAYETCEALRLPDKQYRNDLAGVFKSDLYRLRRAYDASFART